MGVELNEDYDDILALGTAFLGGALSDVDIGDTSSSSDDERSSPRNTRERAVFRRRPRFGDKEGHARWYGDWGTGFWGQYVDPDEVASNELLKA
jgi:hypothetical protein